MSELTKTIRTDGVGMRWIRTAATTITSLAAALMIIYSSVTWVFAPRFNEWITGLIAEATQSLAGDLAETGKQLDRLDTVVIRLEETIGIVREIQETTMARDATPSWRFSVPDTSMSDGKIGGDVVIRAAGFKLRDCGVPLVDLYFINGNDTYHRFTNISLLSSDGRGIALPPDPTRLQAITYTARIPSDDDVTPGRALGFISVTYPAKCPSLEPAVAGPLQFRIIE